MRRTHTESQFTFEYAYVKPDWDIDFAVKKALLEGLETPEQRRYLSQLKSQGYTDEQIELLRAVVQNNG